MSDDRRTMLADLADSINELTEPRQHTEYLEETVTETKIARNGKPRRRSVRRRRAHITTRPGLLIELQDAAVPGSGESAGGAGFESRPSAELGPVSVLREITDDAGFWMRRYKIKARADLGKQLHALVGAELTDTDLGELARTAARWVKRARLATGFDPAPFILNQPCPYCARRHSVTITSDLQNAKCSKCGVTWDEYTIGLLSEMMIANETKDTLALAKCWQTECVKYGEHGADVDNPHADAHGRTWLDFCNLPAVGE